jgi:hypothetical protein
VRRLAACRRGATPVKCGIFTRSSLCPAIIIIGTSCGSICCCGREWWAGSCHWVRTAS